MSRTSSGLARAAAATLVLVGIATFVVLDRGGSDEGAEGDGDRGKPADLALVHGGDVVRACLGTGDEPLCVEQEIDGHELVSEMRLDFWPDQDVTVLLLLFEDEVMIQFTPDRVRRRLPGYTAVTATLDGRHECVSVPTWIGDDLGMSTQVPLTPEGGGPPADVPPDRCPSLG